MENNMVEEFFDNRFALTFEQTDNLIENLFKDFKHQYSCVNKRNYGMSYIIEYNYGGNEISFESERGYLEFRLKINNQVIDLNKYDLLLSNVKVISEKNIKYTFSVLKRYLDE